MFWEFLNLIPLSQLEIVTFSIETFLEFSNLMASPIVWKVNVELRMMTSDAPLTKTP